MLTIYRRHSRAKCKHRQRKFKGCKCPIWVQGTLGGESVRKALDLTSWEAASALISRWNASGEVGGSQTSSMLISDAVGRYLADAEARGLRPATLYKLKTIFEKQLLGFSKEKGLKYLKQLDIHRVREFRESWSDAPLAASKKLQRLRGFFYFCMRSEWITKNPAREVGLPKVPPSPTLPFSEEEMKAILLACEKYPLKGIYGEGNRKRIKAFVLLLRYTGLRIGDVVGMKRERIKDGRVFLYTQKTGVPVRLPLPQIVNVALSELPENGEYFFWSGNGLLKSAVADWQRSLRKLFELAKVENGFAHRFRHSLAVELLMNGVAIEDVAMILGHSVKVCEKHYSPWIQSRQTKLEERIKLTWAS